MTVGANRRVAITGMGAVTPLGNSVETTWQTMVEGRSGIGPITLFDVSAYPVRFAGEADQFDPLTVMERKEAKRMDRYSQLGMAAGIEAVAQAGLTPGSFDPERAGVLYGVGIGGLTTLQEQHQVLLEKGPDRVSPFLVPMMIGNMAAALLSIRFGLKGYNSTVVAACASGSNAIGEAFEMIRSGRLDIMVAGGAEAPISPLGIVGFSSMKALSRRNEDPERASRPFDRDRDGFVVGEGAGALVLEEWEHARARGARILGEMRGYGASSDAYHMVEPCADGAGAALAMERALQDAGVRPEQVGYINAHATSTGKGDIAETMAIKHVFGSHAGSVAVSSTKSMMGHLLGASGAVEAVATVLAAQRGILPPTINLDEPDPLCDLDYVPRHSRKARVDVAMSNSFGFGGHNISLVFGRVAD